MCTHLIRRQATYYFRRVIPADLQPTFGGKREWVYSLKTKDRGQAKRLAQDETVRINRLIDEARGKPLYDTQVTVVPQPVTAPQPIGVMLDTTIVDRWAAERKVADKSRDTHRAVARWFYERVGHVPVRSISRQHVLTFKTKLLDEGQSPANVKVKLQRLRTLLSWAHQNDYATANAGEGVGIIVPDAARNRRRSFDLASLNAIFSSPVFGQGERPVQGRGEAAYWLPLLALFTGARLEELGQLRPEDVVRLPYPDAEGQEKSAWFLRLTEDEADGLRLKNAASERLVPIHPELERLGFVSFASAARRNKRARIFHELRPGAYGRLTAKWGEWFSGYLRTVCNVTDRRMVFHSFRHTFKDHARHVGILEAVQRQIMGHSGDDVADDYGSGHSLFRVVEGMKLYRVPGLRLPANVR
jgi:integrase